MPSKTTSKLDYLIHHIFLPAKLPQCDDYDPAADLELINVAKIALSAYIDDNWSCPHQIKGAMDNLAVNLDSHGHVDEKQLLELLDNGDGSPIPIYVKAQNAGVLVSHVQDKVHFEVYEVSPLNASVYSTNARLQRTFPGAAVAIPMEVVNEEGFKNTIARTLATMSAQRAPEMQPTARKTGRDFEEDRDTADPAMVTELFMGFLHSLGHRVNTTTITKNTREEVLWHNAKAPWRRAPIWTIIRVTVQLLFRRHDNAVGHDYKLFMLYVMADVLTRATDGQIPSDVLHIMNAKICNRLHKLGASVPPLIKAKMVDVLHLSHALIATRWSAIQRSHDGHAIVPLDFDSLVPSIHGLVKIPSLDRYLQMIEARDSSSKIIAVDTKPSASRFPPEQLPNLAASSQMSDKTFVLAAVETWMMLHLDSWLDVHRDDMDVCEPLAALLESYHSYAHALYRDNPEAMSVMVLTIMEAWVAIDKVVARGFPLLLQYKLALPQEHFSSLLLPRRLQMERLSSIEAHMDKREAAATIPNDELFHSVNSSRSFGVKFFDLSASHQQKLMDIEKKAAAQRQAAINQFKADKDHYQQLLDDASSMDCTWQTKIIDSDNDLTEKVHNPKQCERHRKLARAEGMLVKTDEWPLPSHKEQAKVIVFELDVPSAIRIWRDTTAYITFRALGGRYNTACKPRAMYPLQSDRNLAMKQSASASRIGLLSQDKPHHVTHRQTKISVANERHVGLPSGLKYQYFDNVLKCFVDRPCHTRSTIPATCTYRLPSDVDDLQIFINSNQDSLGQPPNVAIAKMQTVQDRALANIPSGIAVRWANILIQLASPTVDFKLPETTLIIFQTIYQTGTISSQQDDKVLRRAHDVVADESFANQMLCLINRYINAISSNWESYQTLISLIAITRRILTINPATQLQSLATLKAARSVAFEWMINVRGMKLRSTSAGDHEAYTLKSTELALVCLDTFDNDPVDTRVLLKNRSDVSRLFQCAMILEQNKVQLLAGKMQWVIFLYLRHRRFMNFIYPVLKRRESSLDEAISAAWTGYDRSSPWTLCTGSLHWLQCMSQALAVHFNVLNGALLVNGLPLDRLPNLYERHQTYQKLFGSVSFEIVPSSTPGLSFSAKDKFASYHVAFEKPDQGDDLYVSASQSGKTYEYLPARLFSGIFPVAFVDSFVHWWNAADGIVEFRPISSAWDLTSTESWTLSRHDKSWRLGRNGVVMLSVLDPLARRVSAILTPLTEATRAHIAIDGDMLVAEIPTLALAFVARSGETSLKSKEFRGFAIDLTQSVGTLIGFRNRLTLEDRGKSKRMLLLLDGPVSYHRQDDGAMIVAVERNTATKAHALTLDEQLQRLKPSGATQSKIFLAYLHALTSSCHPDPFLAMTGTEAALEVLRSAAMRSISGLTHGQTALLQLIGELSPVGALFYPANERVMQTMAWNQHLSPLSQHADFYSAVCDIFESAREMTIFHDNSATDSWNLCPPSVKSEQLLSRYASRTAAFQVPGFGGENKDLSSFKVPPRDLGTMTNRYLNSHRWSTVLNRPGDDLALKIDIDDAIDMWNAIKTIEPPQVVEPHNMPCIGYDSSWLVKDMAELILPKLMTLQQHLCQRNRFDVSLWFSTMASSPTSRANRPTDMAILQLLVAFHKTKEIALVALPSIDAVHRPLGLGASKDTILDMLVSGCREPFSRSPEYSLSRHTNESKKRYEARRRTAWQNNCDKVTRALAARLSRQWPSPDPTLDTSPSSLDTLQISHYIDRSAALKATRAYFAQLDNNTAFMGYLNTLLSTLGRKPISAPAPCTYAPLSAQITHVSNSSFSSLLALLESTTPVLPSLTAPLKASHVGLYVSQISVSEETRRIDGLLASLRAQKGHSFDLKYVTDLEISRQSLQNWQKQLQLVDPLLSLHDELVDLHNACEDDVKNIYATISEAVCNSPGFAIHHWVRITPSLFMRTLRRSYWSNMSIPWKKAIVTYGLALTAFQRAARMLACENDPEELMKEVLNTGHQNWSPFEFPESLLLEVESGIMIRKNQEEVAATMRAVSGPNTAIQLGMGEGKSSLIIPIVAAVLADSSRIVRVVVGKAQSKQLADVLLSKLSGMIGRRVRVLPISRSTQLDMSKLTTLRRICDTCLREGDILLMQPEHILSFQLMCVEQSLGTEGIQQQSAKRLLEIYDYLEANTRDIIDESDSNLDPRQENVYTIGQPQGIDFAPTRWLALQQILSYVRDAAYVTLSVMPDSIELVPFKAGAFPRLRLLKEGAAADLLGRVVDRICSSGLDCFPIARQGQQVRQAVKTYITSYKLATVEIEAVEAMTLCGNDVKDMLLLLRGFFAGGILAFAFTQKRWRVNFGTTVRIPPTQLAVPYRAKDNPAPRSEYSQPEVIQLLTSLSYYYEGLSDAQLFTTLRHLIKGDQSDLKYHTWVQDAADLPRSLLQLKGVNVEDAALCKNVLFPCLRHAKAVVDYFLAHIVFANELRDFPSKLATSGWDLVKPRSQEGNKTTAFSGTIDARAVLPLHIKFTDLPEQRHTNALILDHLLHADNRLELLPALNLPHGDGIAEPRSTAEVLLQAIDKMQPSVQVILDVGAIIIELDNYAVAARWLELNKDADAVVFINSFDEISVLGRKSQGKAESLQSSSFAGHLDNCLVFLDESHCRGIDLKLPVTYRAALTLGPGLTKDTLGQAAMRMRRLGHGQTLTYCVPQDIRDKIVACKPSGAAGEMTISIEDVLQWAIRETSIDIRRSMPLWAAQGQRFVEHNELRKSFLVNGHSTMTAQQAGLFLEKEAQTLSERYDPSRAYATPINAAANLSHPDHAEIQQRCNQFEDLTFGSSALQEEQERELAPEIEQEIHIERPPKADPAVHKIHDDIKRFVTEGTLNRSSSQYMLAFASLASTSIASDFDLESMHTGCGLASNVLVTADFARTVERSSNIDNFDCYQRTVQWILTKTELDGNLVRHLMILSPFEASFVRGLIKLGSVHHRVHLHLYTPRCSLDHPSLDALDLFIEPAVDVAPDLPNNLRIQLNLFAGQLYFGSFAEYREVAAYLGLTSEPAPEGWTVAVDGFILEDDQGRVGGPASSLKSSPVRFLQQLFSRVRRDGQGIHLTHMGIMLGGRLLVESDFT